MPLFSSLQVGDLTLSNRIVMAPLTRSRAGQQRIPNALMKEYYVQRATAGLILSEATAVDPKGVGYLDTPGIWNEAQVAGWREITDAVHAAGGKIVLQLWHVGRISHPDLLDGDLPVAPSAIPAIGEARTLEGKKSFVTPRALELEEIPGIVEAYKRGAQNALEAGFDGVEIHGANGYLPDQFLRDGANQRTDEYGGSMENRARLLLEVTDAAIEVWGPKRVGVHLSPRNTEYHSMQDSDTMATFTYVARELGKRQIAFIFVREELDGQPLHLPVLAQEFRANGGGIVIANDGFTSDSAVQVLNSGVADAVAWGRQFIANPDLPTRLKQNAPLNDLQVETLYAPGPQGYTDYPFLAQP